MKETFNNWRKPNRNGLRLTWRVPEKHVTERHDLDGLSQTHGVGQDAAEALALVEPLGGLDDVVVQETDATDLE